MESLKNNAIKYLESVLLLFLFSAIKYLLIPNIEDYELFSYVFGGGLLLYAIFQTIIYFIELIFNMRRESLTEVIVSLVLLEILLYIFLESSLVLALLDKDDIELFLIYQIIPIVVTLTHRIYMKWSRRGMKPKS